MAEASPALLMRRMRHVVDQLPFRLKSWPASSARRICPPIVDVPRRGRFCRQSDGSSRRRSGAAICGAWRLGARTTQARRRSSSARTAMKLSHWRAAWLRQEGIGAASSTAASTPMSPQAARSSGATGCSLRDAEGRAVWVTRERPKIDRIACPWLIRRFVDPQRGIPFRPPAEWVRDVAERMPATPFDVADVDSGPSRRDSAPSTRCSSDFGLRGARPARLAADRAGADTDRHRSCAARRRACSPSRSGCRACSPTTSSSSRRACTLYDALLSLVPRRDRARRTTGTRTHARRRRMTAAAFGRDPGKTDRRRLRRAVPRGAARLAEDRPRQFRRAGRADRAHASRAGRGEALDRRDAIPARAELLHAAARPRGAAARDLCRLAHARRARRHRRRRALRAARLRRPARAQHRLSCRSAICRSCRACSSA